DNLLWYDVGYTYSQPLCQYRTHVGGADTFVNFGIGLEDKVWTPFFENPFLFYDHDFDNVTEEVLRLSGIDYRIDYLRHSFDADHDGTWDNPRDFDCSLSAHAPENLTFDESEAEHITLRGIPTGPFTRYRTAPEIVKGVVWKDMLLTWDENDNNVDGQRFADDIERWEGVIADGTDEFKQIGGPSGGPTNKRNELITEPKGPAVFYYHPADQRIHLMGAEKAWTKVDYDMDQEVDTRYGLVDTNSDGYIDTWRIDFGADGSVEEEWSSPVDTFESINWVWPDVNSVMQPVIQEVPNQLFALVQCLEQAIKEETGEKTATVLGKLIHSGFDNEHISMDLRKKYLNSHESLRYYFEIYKDELIHQLRGAFKDESFWKEFDGLRSKGELTGMTDLLEKQFQIDESEIQPLEYWVAKRRMEIAESRVAWAQDWVPPNIGWESEKIAYRVYWGQFDFFGKKEDVLLYPTIGSQSYHEETDWGIDALLVGDSPGCGGMTLYVDGEPYPAWANLGESKTKFEKKLVYESDSMVTIEYTAEPVGPEDSPYSITVHCTALEGKPYSPVEIRVSGAENGKKLQIGIGFTKLGEEELALDTETGVFGIRGYQDPAIGRIGMGLVFPKDRYAGMKNLDNQNQIVIDVDRNIRSMHYIQCEWLRGVRFNRSPSLGDWMDDLRETAMEVDN
ncbi:MAG: DUF4861 family protein, partial [Candidatus Omnitrophica bacterium]|nr:DUF4861 family protein [Candidatus Omnitrophota bacterium]